ncbi:MAG: prepilin-type N-terminal cleavage/methylation domain-containing protein [Acidobacteriales bacterium]|nr:prepilin-type N-terminal cleavage/methylation domain-containing protein [Terriglobales bacterium]
MRLQPAQIAGKGRKQKRQGIDSRGFSLIELLIVVAIILIIAAIAIPNFMRVRMQANETAAVANLRNLTTAQVVYATTYGIGFSATLADLGGAGPATPTSAGLIDSVLASGLKSGYIFTYSPVDANSDGVMDTYTINADPATPGSTGQRFFFTDQSAVIRQNLTSTASVSDPPI